MLHVGNRPAIASLLNHPPGSPRPAPPGPEQLATILATVAQMKPATWSYDIDPATGVSRATYPGEVTLPGQVINVTGVTNGTNATPGSIGEYVTNGTATNVALTTNVVANVVSMALTAGDWDIDGVVQFTASVGASQIAAGVGSSGVLPNLDTGGLAELQGTGATILKVVMPTSLLRLNANGPNTIWLTAMATFTAGTVGAQGYMQARRRR
jgi:hypothetical protein